MLGYTGVLRVPGLPSSSPARVTDRSRQPYWPSNLRQCGGLRTVSTRCKNDGRATAVPVICKEVAKFAAVVGKPVKLEGRRLPLPSLGTYIEELFGDDLEKALQMKTKKASGKAIDQVEEKFLRMLTREGIKGQPTVKVEDPREELVWNEDEDGVLILEDGEVDEGDIHVRQGSQNLLICAGVSSGERRIVTARGILQNSSGSGGQLEATEVDLLNAEDNLEGERAEGGPRRDSDNASSSSESPFILFSIAPMMVYPLIAEGPGYSQASYYTSLGLFVISVPGIWSLVKRSTKSKIVKKTFELPGPTASEGKSPSQIAGEITSSLTRNNFAVAERGETVTFEGSMVPSRGQAAFLSFCTAVSLGCVALVLSITAPAIGENWYYLTVLSPLAGFYYWTRASRKEQIKVKLVLADDESSTDVIIQGDDEQIDRLRRELGLMEKGMVYVKGLLER